MPTYLRYAAGAIGAIVVLVLALAPLASVLSTPGPNVIWKAGRGSCSCRSRIMWRGSLQPEAARRWLRLFEQLTEDEKLLAVGYCEEDGELRFATKLMPSSFTCASLARGETGTFSTIESDGNRILVASFPIAAADGAGHLAVLHDLSFVKTAPRRRDCIGPWR